MPKNEIMALSFLTHSPTKIVLVGLNYRDHAKELEMPLPAEPILFMKPVTALIGPEESIRYPPQATRVDYEAELAVIIKDTCKDLAPEDVRAHVDGFTCLNDVTARDIQKRDGQWTRAKSFDSFCPIGPKVVADVDPNNLKIQSFLNGKLRQDSNTANFVFTVEELVSFISHVMTLMPGDIIATGTPGGIGAMDRGDTIEIRIEGIGTLRNYVG
ncbi:2-keto-4-pentenoate hydratase/2-oxohepta-3-ene-1,7-dioic acid hydratase [Candidatus Methanophagaceae archaeon]|nr:2-keto-4-pentenoate hydratase/2-oxohepta-3-ene-1,7-dioic acid hydratase [Methanophagales archaeon]